MEINVASLHKVVKTIPQQMRSILKAKGGLLQKGGRGCNFFFGQAVYFNMQSSFPSWKIGKLQKFRYFAQGYDGYVWIKSATSKLIIPNH